MPKMAKTDKEVIEDYQKAIASIIQLMKTMQKVFESSVASIAKAASLIGEVDARSDGGGLRDQETMAESQEAELHDWPVEVPALSHMRIVVRKPGTAWAGAFSLVEALELVIDLAYRRPGMLVPEHDHRLARGTRRQGRTDRLL
jgi:hypothetical protein